MATNRASTNSAANSTWGISPSIRRALARGILELRSAVEDDYRKQLFALGIRPAGTVAPARTLDLNEQRTRDVASAVVARDVQAGIPHAHAVDRFVRESAYTFLNRLVGLRCLDERALLVVDGQVETAVKLDPARNASSLYWRVRNALPATANPRDVWRETLGRAGTAISARIRVLFDPEAEHASLLPLLPTLQRVVGFLNSDDVPESTWAEDEVLGWVYQYYQSAEKDAAYARLAKGKKLEGPEELAAATCLYTERYMVDYLLQNTLGALWMEMYPNSRLPEQWPYYVRPPEDSPRPTREPRPLRSITVIDPACGSGHFLVRAFDLLVQMYREEGRAPESEIPHLILERNLYGIDIDARAVQIAALALYLKACSLAGPDFQPRQVNLVAADALLPGNEPAAEYLARFKNDPDALSLVKGIWQGLRNVREFGSLLHPERAVDASIESLRKTHPMLVVGGQAEEWKRNLLHGLSEEFERLAQSEDIGQRLFGEEAAKGVSLVEALGRTYDVVVMNPPYAGSRNLKDRLKVFVDREYSEGKRDLYAAFVQRCREFAEHRGYVGMVTQQSWLFLRSFAGLRKLVLSRTTLNTVAHLGEHAFDESAAAGAFVTLFTVRNARPEDQHRIVAFRLIGPKTPADKDFLLRRSIDNGSSGVLTAPAQDDLIAIPEVPVVYWASVELLRLLAGPHRLRDIATIHDGMTTGDNERFVRFFWEVQPSPSWTKYSKGGEHRRWFGLDWYRVAWGDDGREIKAHPKSYVRNETLYGRPGITYNLMARGSMAARLVADSAFDPTGLFVNVKQPETELFHVLALLNSHATSYLLRLTSQGLKFNGGYVSNLPLPPRNRRERMGAAGKSAVALKREMTATDPVETSFRRLPTEVEEHHSDLLAVAVDGFDHAMQASALLLTIEGLNDTLATEAFGLLAADVSVMVDETGAPAAWHPLVTGYESLPEAPADIALDVDLDSYLQATPRFAMPSKDREALTARLSMYYRAGRGFQANEGSGPLEASADEEDELDAGSIGARIPIPAETFLEKLAEELQVHPVSVYLLLREMREQEGLVCPPELKRHFEDYASVTVLRLLGYRWPEQDGYEVRNGPILEPAIVDRDGIIPLVDCGDEPVAAQRIRARLERQFGEKGAERSEKGFRQSVGRSIEDWLKRDFFKRHIQQFKQRPIAWHLVSPERNFEAFLLYHRLTAKTLYALRTTYAGGRIRLLRAEQDRARQANDARKVSDIQIQIEDVEEFRDRIEKIERGDELKYRIRCRWKGEEESGRPGPYAPDIDDGVKVNIRPFQEAGLLAVKEVIRKW